MDLTAILRSIKNPVLDFVYPPVCIACQTPLQHSKHRICDECWNSIGRLSTVHPLYQDTRRKLLAGGYVSDLVSVFVFEKEGAFQHIAHALKYGGYESIGRDLGMKLVENIIAWGMHADYLVPIPLHKAKQRERGYNQAEQIARGVSSVAGIQVLSGVVKRVKHTQTQTQLDSDERKKNMQDAFAINDSRAKLLQRKTCLLIDDVITTGATINSCARELLKAGASRVIAASAALAQ